MKFMGACTCMAVCLSLGPVLKYPSNRSPTVRGLFSRPLIVGNSLIWNPAPPNYPLRNPKYHLIESIRPLIEVHWGV